jgi:hypothetical protein
VRDGREGHRERLSRKLRTHWWSLHKHLPMETAG